MSEGEKEGEKEREKANGRVLKKDSERALAYRQKETISRDRWKRSLALMTLYILHA